MSKKQLITYLTIVYIALLTTFCLVKISVPSPDLLGIDFDKLVHFGLYLGLNTLLLATVIAHKGKVTAKQIIATTLASIAYGVIIEFIQQQVGRDFDLYDIVANAIGAATAGSLLSIPKIYNFIREHL